MQIPVLMEPVSGSGFRASLGAPLALTAEGSSREEALKNLRGLLNERLSQGASIVPLEMPAVVEHTWAPFAGMFKDDSLFDEWQEAIAENRRQVDEAEGRCPGVGAADAR